MSSGQNKKAGASAAATNIQANFLGQLSKKNEQKLEGQDFDPDFNNPAFLKAVVRIQASFRGHQCRKALDDADMALYCP